MCEVNMGQVTHGTLGYPSFALTLNMGLSCEQCESHIYGFTDGISLLVYSLMSNNGLDKVSVNKSGHCDHLLFIFWQLSLEWKSLL